MPVKRTRLTARRKVVGLSQEMVAERLQVDRSTVVRWERGETEPQPWKRTELAKALRVSVEQLDELLNEPSSAKADPGEEFAGVTERAGESGGKRLCGGCGLPLSRYNSGELCQSCVSQGNNEQEFVKRREFLVGMAATVGYGAAVSVTPPFKHVDPDLIPYFQQQLEGHYRADMLLGPRALISTVTAQCSLIGQLVDSADEPTRQQMALVGTSFATFAAWLYLDAGDVHAALYWHDAAQEMAHRSGDREAVACALVDRAMARTDQGIGTAVIDLCKSALMDDGHLSPEVRVFALQQQAHGASLIGDRRQVDALLDTAGRVLGQVDVEVWGTACLRTPHYVEVQRATCYGRLGLVKEALGVWQQVIPAAPSNARRDVGVWVARQATLSASLREPERTVELARHAVKAALETGSARVRRELAAAKVTMAPWQDEPVGRDFAEVLAPVSEGV